jgi:hypothetical protein
MLLPKWEWICNLYEIKRLTVNWLIDAAVHVGLSNFFLCFGLLFV